MTMLSTSSFHLTKEVEIRKLEDPQFCGYNSHLTSLLGLLRETKNGWFVLEINPCNIQDLTPSEIFPYTPSVTKLPNQWNHMSAGFIAYE